MTESNETVNAAPFDSDGSFDTHEYVKELTDVGVPEPQAEVFAKARATDRKDSEARKDDFDKFEKSMKDDFDKFETKVKADLEAHKREIKADLEAHKREIKADLKAHKREVKADLEVHRREIDIKLDSHKREISAEMTVRIAESENRMIKWMIGVGIGVVVAFGAAVGVLQFIWSSGVTP